MELEKIRNLGDDELRHQEKTSAEQLFRIRFQMATDPSSGAKKLRELRKEIAQIKTVTRERELGIHGEARDAKPVVAVSAAKAEAPRSTAKAPKAAKKAAPKTAAKTKTAKAKESGK
ncbi:MAG: 50S ribosomal protein L29 [Terracidiphilus sp.]